MGKRRRAESHFSGSIPDPRPIRNRAEKPSLPRSVPQVPVFEIFASIAARKKRSTEHRVCWTVWGETLAQELSASAEGRRVLGVSHSLNSRRLFGVKIVLNPYVIVNHIRYSVHTIANLSVP